MGSLLALAVIVAVALIAVRVGSTALMMTGLSRDTAQFQAYSAFFGVGFTTREAELVVNHPGRRRIIRDLILVGNVGFGSAMATLIVTFVQVEGAINVLRIVGLLAGGAVVLWLISRIGLFNRGLEWLIRFSLKKAGTLHVLDYELLLRIKSGYCISEIELLEDNPLAGKSLRDTRPADKGLVVLGITRGDNAVFTGAPSADAKLEVGDVLTVYGREDALATLAAGTDVSTSGDER